MTQPLSYEIITPRGYVIDKITHKVRCEQWTAIINECLASGMPKTTWCKANGISDKQFFYWQRILRQEAYQQMESQSASPASSALVPDVKVPILLLSKSVLSRQRSDPLLSDQM